MSILRVKSSIHHERRFTVFACFEMVPRLTGISALMYLSSVDGLLLLVREKAQLATQ